MPGSLPLGAVFASSLVVLGSSLRLRVGHTSATLHSRVSVMPHTSGERSHARPLTMPDTGPTSSQAPISTPAVPTSVGTSEIRASVTVGLASRPLFVSAAVMCHTGLRPGWGVPVQ